MDLVNVISSIYDSIKTAIEFISAMVVVVFDSLGVIFASFPTFISVGLGFVFSLGILILILKIVRG